MNAVVMRLELRRVRSLVFWLALVSILYAATMAAFYPTIQRDTQAVQDMLKLWPKEMLAAFSIEGDLSDQGSYFNVYVFALIWPIVAAIAAILVPTRTIPADLERNFLELPLSTGVSRTRYLASAIVVQIAAIAVLALATVASIVVVGPIVGVTFDPGRFLVVGLLLTAFGCAFAAAATLLSVVTLSRGRASGIVAGLLVAMYLLQTVAKLSPDLSGLSVVSAFRYFTTPPVINAGTLPIGDLAVFAVAAAACWIASLWLFRRRDLVA